MNSKLRVLLTKPFFPEDIEYLSANLAKNVELVSPAEFTTDALAKTVQDDIDVLLGATIAKPMLDNATSLKLIQIPWTGVDALNYDLLRQYNFTVCNSHSNAAVVAEFALSLMMSAAKKITFHDRELRHGKWWRPQRGVENSFFPPATISGKTVGFIGYGAIARKITQYLGGFSAGFIAAAAHEYQAVPAPLSFIGGPNSIGFVASNADFLFITLPLTDKTKGLIDKAFFAKMKPSAYLINVSRGEVIKEDDLYLALKNKVIAGAAIDTWYNYPAPGNPDVLPSRTNPFETLDNLVLSPHRAGFSEGGFPHLDDAIDNINRLATGQPLINIVNLEDGY